MKHDGKWGTMGDGTGQQAEHDWRWRAVRGGIMGGSMEQWE